MSPPVAPPVAGLVPHAGPMCLLERVVDWSDEGIRCEATVTEAHPLRTGGRLPATALIEYAAQAMAAHGRLLADASASTDADHGTGPRDGESDGHGHGDHGDRPARPRPGRLVGLRATELACRWVDERKLRIEVRRLGGDPANVLYGFTVFGRDGAEPLASGRAIVTLEAAT